MNVEVKAIPFVDRLNRSSGGFFQVACFRDGCAVQWLGKHGWLAAERCNVKRYSRFKTLKAAEAAIIAQQKRADSNLTEMAFGAQYK